MPKKPDAPEQPDEQKILEEKVDQLMAAKGKDSQPAVAIAVEDAAEDPDDERASPKTAPELPKKLQVKTDENNVYKPDLPVEPPIVIELADDKAGATDTDGDGLSDKSTDQAVDEILAQESDKLLAVDDAMTARKQRQLTNQQPGWKARLVAILKNKWTWIGLAALLVLLLALPPSRYKLLGLFIKKPVTIQVVDNQTGSAVSQAQVELAGGQAKTDANGRARLKAAVGSNQLIIKKQYYNDHRGAYFVGFKAGKTTTVKLTATGRLVPITVINKITGKPLGGTQVKILNTTAKTNAKGQALVALPANATTYPGNLKLSGYNPAAVTVQVTDKPVKANTFELTPSGQIYFLSNRDGNLDVVKANLDGSGRQTVLEGTGREDPNTTSLLAARDWRFLVLKARRDAGLAALYLIDTKTDKVSLFDNSNAEFNLVGWYGHAFVYELTRHGVANWQAGRQLLKSYDADHQQLNQIDQNQAEGQAGQYAYQQFYNFYLVNGAVVYNSQWNSFGAYDTAGKTDAIRAVSPAGQNKKDYQTFPVGTVNYFQTALYEPDGVYYAAFGNDGKTTYYVFEDQTVRTANLDAGAFNKTYPTFLISPSGNRTFWTELRDGKNTLFTGNTSAADKKQIASQSVYAPYGWYGDNYLLVSKDGSELYVMPAAGPAKSRQAIKITDYYKPPQTYAGYGYGYGGL